MDAFLDALGGSPWLFPAVFLLVVGDAFLVVLPSETVVVALGALAGATGSPLLGVLIPVAAIGAVVGDSLCYLIGRRVGIDSWAWQRAAAIGGGADARAIDVLARPAVLIFTARYIPFARIAVNLSAGASRASVAPVPAVVGGGGHRVGALQHGRRAALRRGPAAAAAARDRAVGRRRDHARLLVDPRHRLQPASALVAGQQD